MNEHDLAAEATKLSIRTVEMIHASGRVDYDTSNDVYLITPDVLAHAIACAMLAWEHRNMPMELL